MTDNNFEYVVDEKAKGKNLIFRILLIAFYIVFGLAYFIFFCRIGFVPVIAMLPFLLWIIIFFTWRYVSVSHEYIIATGEITFSHIYSNKKRKEVLRLSIREVTEVAPYDERKQTGIKKIYDFRGDKDSPDSYFLVFKTKTDAYALVYFEATKKALKLMQLYNPGVVKMEKTLRY